MTISTHKSRRFISVYSLFFLLGWTLYFLFFWSHAIFTDELGNLQVSHVSIWGDWAAHFTMGSSMAFHELIPSNSPFIINAPFSYPFVANLISAVLIQQNVPFFLAFVLPSALCSILLVFALFAFYRYVFRSEAIAVVASSIYLFNGGLGFVQYITDILQSQTPLDVIINPPAEYTHLSEWSIEWISVIYSMVIPQRAFTLGFPLALIALVLIHKVFFSKKIAKKQYALLTISAVLVGSLTLVHSHSFLSVMIILPFWGVATLIEKKRPFKETVWLWVYWLAITAMIAIPLVQTYLSKNISSGFFEFYPGWFAKEKEMNWLLFWLYNWGITPIAALLGYFIQVKSAKSTQDKLSKLLFFLPFFVIFMLLNIFLFQPFIWDNTKLLAWSSVGISGLAGFSLFYLWKVKVSPRFKLLKRLAISSVAIISFAIIIFSGAIDAWRVLRFDLHTYQMYSAEELELAEWAKANTPANSIWLTGDQHNNWLYNLTGRQPLMTFRGWLWTHGYDYLQVESDVSTMYTDPNPELIEKYGIDFAVIGANEMNVWHADKRAFDQQYHTIMQTTDYTVYDLNEPAN